VCVADLALLLLAFLSPASQGQLYDDAFVTAEQYYREGKAAEAEALYARIGPGHPDYPQAQLRLGTIFYSTGRPVLAEHCLREALRFHESAETYCLLAGAQFNQEKFDEAYTSARKALQLDDKYAKAHTALAMVYTARKDWPHAARGSSLRCYPARRILASQQGGKPGRQGGCPAPPSMPPAAPSLFFRAGAPTIN
jgi:tetratricopeptide (TPR) repeat protein